MTPAVVTVDEQLLLALEAAVARASREARGEGEIVWLDPRCRLCGAGTGRSIGPDGSLHLHAEPAVTPGGLCRDCARCVARARAEGRRPPRADATWTEARRRARSRRGAAA
jgi:hypothetical protein